MLTVSGAETPVRMSHRGMRAIGFVSIMAAALLIACDATPSPTITPTPTAVPPTATPTPRQAPVTTPTPTPTLTLQDQLLQELVAARATATALTPTPTPTPEGTLLVPTATPTPIVWSTDANTNCCPSHSYTNASPRPHHWNIPGNIPRFSHQALLLDDSRILVSGGFTGIANNNFIVPFPLDTIDIYDPKTGLWSTVPLEDQREVLSRALKLRDGTVLFIGAGAGSNEQAAGVAFGLNITDLSWRHFADPPTARAFHSMVLLRDGRVMVAGGIDLNDEGSSYFPEPINAVDILDPAANTWQQAAPMSTASWALWLFLLNDGRVLSIGTDETSNDLSVHVQIYDPDSDSWVVVDSHDPYYVPNGSRPTLRR